MLAVFVSELTKYQLTESLLNKISIELIDVDSLA